MGTCRASLFVIDNKREHREKKLTRGTGQPTELVRDLLTFSNRSMRAVSASLFARLHGIKKWDFNALKKPTDESVR
jgi:hypothetical protein